MRVLEDATAWEEEDNDDNNDDCTTKKTVVCRRRQEEDAVSVLDCVDIQDGVEPFEGILDDSSVEELLPDCTNEDDDEAPFVGGQVAL